MTIPIILTVLAALVSLVWSSRHLMIRKEKRSGFSLSEAYNGPPENAPPISVIVAAKDEAENIETCVRTMLDQDYPDFELLVCNDRSEDDTAAIVERIAVEDSRLRLINIEHLPEGWCGKNNAMQIGIRQAKHDWICMIDADCRQISTRTLSTAMQYALDRKTDMLSVLPTLEMKSFWENVIQPVCSGIMMIWFHPDKVNNPDKPNAYANGAFMLMRRDVYEEIGTHEAVKDRVNEDMHMALRVKQAGRNLRVVRSRDLYVVRMYTSLGEIVRGWSRIFYGTFCTMKRLTLSLVVLVVMGLLPWTALILGLVMVEAGAYQSAWWWTCGIVGAIASTLQISVIFRFYGLINAKASLAWTYPLGCIIAICTVLLGIKKLLSGGKVTWRGTNYTQAN